MRRWSEDNRDDTLEDLAIYVQSLLDLQDERPKTAWKDGH